jgi:hypothetical protein
MHLTDRLKQIYEKHQDELPEYGWASERDRWAELMFCLLCRVRDDELDATRAAVDLLNLLGLLDVNVLAALSGQDAAILDRVLRSNGFSAAQASRGADVLKAVAARTRKDFHGKLQRVLRKHGELLRQELSGAFASCGLKRPDIDYAVSQWLQNAASLPISLESNAVKAFCKSNRVGMDQLLNAADALDVNVALVDDLLALDQSTRRRR